MIKREILETMTNRELATEAIRVVTPALRAGQSDGKIKKLNKQSLIELISISYDYLPLAEELNRMEQEDKTAGEGDVR